MEISGYGIDGLSIEEIPLSMDGEFTLCFTQVILEGKSYVADVFLKFKNDVIANNWLEVIEFFSFIDAYIKRGLVVGHENYFFKVAQKDQISSLKCKFITDEYFISMPKAKTMLTVYNEFRSGNSFKYLIKCKTILSNEDSKVTIFSSYVKEEDVKNAIREYLKKNSGTFYENYTMFNEEILKYYNLIKYSGENI